MKLVPYNELKTRYGIAYCRVHLMRKVSSGEFPPPVPLSARRIAWVESEVEKWLSDLTKTRIGIKNIHIEASEDKPDDDRVTRP